MSGGMHACMHVLRTAADAPAHHCFAELQAELQEQSSRLQQGLASCRDDAMRAASEAHKAAVEPLREEVKQRRVRGWGRAGLAGSRLWGGGGEVGR